MASLVAFALLAGCPHRALYELDPQLDSHQAPTPRVQADARARYLEAVVAEERGAHDRADEAYAWVVRLDRKNPWSHLAYGAYRERRDQPALALASYRAAVALEPTLPAANLSLARLLVREGFAREVGGVLDALLAAHAQCAIEHDQVDTTCLALEEAADEVERMSEVAGAGAPR